MTTKTSQLIVRLRDEVSTPAGKAARSLKGLKSEASGAAHAGKGVARIGNAALALGGGALSVYGFGKAISDTVTKTADLDRRMTRIRVTAGASANAMTAATKQMQDLAVEAALPFDKVAEGLEALVAQGRSLDDAMSFLPAVVRTAQAAGAEVDDIAKTADAVGTNFRIAGKDMQNAFDIMVEGGKAGQFELKDMARYLPSLAPAAAAVGLKGAEGLSQIVAMLQVVRKGTGTAEEAASSMKNIFQKMESEQTAKKFADFGIDLPKAMAKARKQGKNLLEVFEELAFKATKGDLSKLPQLFTDMEYATGMRALLSFRGEWQKLQAEMRKNAAGSTMRDFNEVAKGARAEIDRLGQSWDNFQTRLGKKMEPAVVGVLQSIREQLDGTAQPKAIDLPVVRPGMNLPLKPDRERINRPAPGSGGYRSREKTGFVYDPEIQSTRQFMNNFAKGMQAQRARQVGAPVSSTEQFVTQVSVPNMIDEIRSRAQAAGGITVGQSIREQMAAEAELKRLRDRHIAAKQAEADRTGPGPSPIEEMEFRQKVPVLVKNIMEHEAARNGQAVPDEAVVDSRIHETFRQVEGAIASTQQALQSLDLTVAPNVDLASLHETDSLLDSILKKLGLIGPMARQAAGATSQISVASNSPRGVGSEFESRRGGSFADWEP